MTRKVNTGVRLDEDMLVQMVERARAEAKGNTGALHRRLLAYGLAQMPAGWTPDAAAEPEPEPTQVTLDDEPVAVAETVTDEPEPETERRCETCEEVKPLTKFATTTDGSRGRDGRALECRACRDARRRARRVARQV